MSQQALTSNEDASGASVLRKSTPGGSLGLVGAENDPSRFEESGTIVPIGKRAASRTKRLNINLPVAVFDELEELAKSTGRTMTDIVRLSLGVSATVITEEKLGHRIVITDRHGKALKELILPK